MANAERLACPECGHRNLISANRCSQCRKMLTPTSSRTLAPLNTSIAKLEGNLIEKAWEWLWDRNRNRLVQIVLGPLLSAAGVPVLILAFKGFEKDWFKPLAVAALFGAGIFVLIGGLALVARGVFGRSFDDY